MPEETREYTPSQELPLDEGDLRIGKAFAESRAAWKVWARAVDRGDDETARKMSERMESLKEQSRAEWLATALKEHGYSPDEEEVILQPYTTIGWGEEGSLQGGIPQQNVDRGDAIRVKVKDIDWSGAATGSARTYDVRVPIPGERGMAYLVRKKQ